MKISDLFKIKIKKTTCLKEFYIGKNRFVIIELLDNKNNMVKDKVVKILLTSNLNVYWFKNYSEMEYVLDYLSIDNIQFIIIG